MANLPETELQQTSPPLANVQFTRQQEKENLTPFEVPHHSSHPLEGKRNLLHWWSHHIGCCGNGVLGFELTQPCVALQHMFDSGLIHSALTSQTVDTLDTWLAGVDGVDGAEVPVWP